MVSKPPVTDHSIAPGQANITTHELVKKKE
jgi:hypothetical protein